MICNPCHRGLSDLIQCEVYLIESVRRANAKNVKNMLRRRLVFKFIRDFIEKFAQEGSSGHFSKTTDFESNIILIKNLN